MRRNVSLTPRHLGLVAKHAAEYGLGFSEALRRMVDEYDRNHPLPPDEPG